MKRKSNPKSAAGYVEPKATRPKMPQDYGLSRGKKGLLPWSWLEERMVKAHNYWIGTTRADGRPHTMPVWGVWLERVFYFGTGRRSRKAINLLKNPAVVVHLESGDEAVILEGFAEEVLDPPLLARCVEVYQAKYKLRPDPTSGSVVYAVRPRVAFAWRERDFPTSATRWLLDA